MKEAPIVPNNEIVLSPFLACDDGVLGLILKELRQQRFPLFQRHAFYLSRVSWTDK